MPIYEYRCQSCQQVSSFFFKVASAATEVNCEHCGDYGVERIMASFSRGRTEADQRRDLVSRYYKMVDDALGKSPASTTPEHYLDKMAPFSAAEQKGDSYFHE